jgi:hypothetical protein
MDRKPRVLRAGLGALLVASLLVVGVVYAASFDVDTFNDDAAYVDLTVYDLDGYRVATGEGDHANILGGEHDVELELSSDGDADTESVDAILNGYYDGPLFIDTNKLQFEAGSDTGAVADLTVTWDGNDNDNGSSLDHTGLNGENLVDDTNEGLLLTVLSSDQDVTIGIEGYSSSSDWSETSISLLGDTSTELERFDLFFPFDNTSIWTDHGTGVDWGNLGALVFVLNGTSNLDFALDNLEATTVREYGDLPSSYGTNVLDANHIPWSLRLGHNCDAESDDNASTDTQGDDTDRTYDDEDGVRPTGTWAAGTDGGHVEVVVSGCDGTCYLNGWINWDSDSDSNFTDGGEQIFTDEPLGNGTHDLDFDVPSGTSFDDIDRYARFRICESQNECDTPTAQNVFNGEIEDYLFHWGPTAITLTDITAQSNTLPLALGVVALVAVGLMGAVVILRRRRA